MRNGKLTVRVIIFQRIAKNMAIWCELVQIYIQNNNYLFMLPKNQQEIDAIFILQKCAHVYDETTEAVKMEKQ